MEREQLFFHHIGNIEGGKETAVITLVNEDKDKVLYVICSKIVKQLIYMSGRFDSSLMSGTLVDIVKQMIIASPYFLSYEMTVFDVRDGEYRVRLTCADPDEVYSVKMCDAVLLYIITGIPLYIDKELFDIQYSNFEEKEKVYRIPLNAMDTLKLLDQLEEAIEKEDYAFAAKIKKELDERVNLLM